MSKFVTIQMLVMDQNGDAWHTGWAQDCKTMLQTAYPGLPYDVFNRPEIKKMMDEVDNVTGTLFVTEPVEGQPLLANSTYEGLEKEYKEWLSRKTLCNAL